STKSILHWTVFMSVSRLSEKNETPQKYGSASFHESDYSIIPAGKDFFDGWITHFHRFEACRYKLSDSYYLRFFVLYIGKITHSYRGNSYNGGAFDPLPSEFSSGKREEDSRGTQK